MEKAYKFRLYPNAGQETLIQKTFGCCRYVFNQYHAKKQALYNSDKTKLSYKECSNDMTKLKKEAEWLNEVDSSALQSSLKNLDMAYKNFFDRIRKGEKEKGFPKFKSKKNPYKSYTSKYTNGNITLSDKQIKLPKLGLVECRVSKQIEGRIISATVSQNPSGKYFVSVCCTDVMLSALSREPFAKTGAVTGIDVGLKEFAILADGDKIKNHKYLRKSEKKLVREQRRLSRKPKGSQNRNKARIKVARVHEKITNQRNDFLHKTTTDLVKTYDVISVESLKIKNMVKNHKLAKSTSACSVRRRNCAKLNKSISDVSWGEFVRQLEYKCEWYGKTLVKIPTFFASSQTCHKCGFQNIAVKDLSIRSWTCPNCGAEHDRDINAAINILNKGLENLA